MNESRLETYREKILTMKTQGLNKAAMLRQIEQQHGVRIGKSQFYAFVDQIANGAAPELEGGLFMTPKSQPLHSPLDEEVRAFYTNLPIKLDEVRKELANVLQWQYRVDEEAEQREQMTRDALKQFQEMLTGIGKQIETLRTAANSKTPRSFMPERRSLPSLPSPGLWKRALLYTGTLWGIIVFLFVLGYWRPLWVTLMKWL